MTDKDQVSADKATTEEEELIAYLLEREQRESAGKFAIQARTAGVDAPLSFGQQRLWFLDQLEPGNPAYHLSFRQRYQGELDTAALQAALNEIVRRHEIFRTTFRLDAGDTVQHVNEQVTVAIEWVDATGVASAEALEARLKTLFRTPFDLERGPLLRAWLFQTGSEQYLLFITVHHIAGDRLSMIQFARELDTLYRAYAAGADSPLAPLPIQYADYAAWERAPQREAVYQRDLEYWRARLARLTTLELPTDYPRPPSVSFEGGQVSTLYSRDLLKRIDKLGQQFGATRFMVLLASLAVLLHRLSGQDDIVLGTPISNRNLPELEHLIGYFTNTLVLRVDLSGNPTVGELIGRVRETALGAYAHQDVPFEKLVEDIKPERDLSRNPLFQVLAVQLSGAADNLHALSPVPAASVARDTVQEGGKLQIQPAVLSEPEKTTVDYDLEVYMSQHPDGLAVGFCYKTDLFESATVRGMLEQCGRLALAMTANPDCPVGELYMLGEEEKRLAMGLRGPDLPDHEFEPVYRRVERRAGEVPDSVAVVAGDGELTYAGLERRSNQLARALVDRGLGPEDLVGICLHRSCDLLVAVLAAFKAGCAYVPLDPAFPPARLAFMVEDAGLDLVLTAGGAADFIAGDVPRLDLDREADDLATLASEPLATVTAPTQLAYVIYTSGSTGQPKGVRIEHAALSNFVLGLSQHIGFGPEDHLLSVASLSFDASVLDLYVPLVSGASVILVDRDTARDGIALTAMLESSPARVMHATPSTWQLLISSGWQGNRQLRALSGGEELPRTLADRLRNLCGGLWNLYGPTETTVYSSVSDLGRPASRNFVDLGQPIARTQIYVLDSALQLVPPGVVGELCIAGAGVARDYLNRPELTGERFRSDPFSERPGARLYRTGDLARLHRDGSIEYLGRSDHQVKLRGYRIELGEIEAAITDLEGVSQSVVLCREDVAGDPRLVAYTVTESGEAIDVDLARARLRERLPGYMVPAAFVNLSEMPLTPNAKIDRLALPPPPTTVRVQAESFREPTTPSELALAEVWRELLDIDRVGLDENFFDLGGHSLLAVKAIFEMKRRTGITISPAEYMMQTLGQIAVHYDAEPASPQPKRRLFGLSRKRPG